MRFLLAHFFRRLTRDGVKSLSIPLLAFVLAVLINLLGGVKAWLEDEYEYMMDSYPIVAELSDLTGSVTDGLSIGAQILGLFTDPEVPLSLANHTGGLTLKRTLDTSIGPVTGITVAEDEEITFYEGYGESIFKSEELICVVSEDMLERVENGALKIIIEGKLPDEYLRKLAPDIEVFQGGYYRRVLRGNNNHLEPVSNEDAWIVYEVIEGEKIVIEKVFAVAGTVEHAERGTVLAPFWTVSALGEEAVNSAPHTEKLSAIISDNRRLSEFKQIASVSFPRVRPIFDSRPVAMTVYDSEFYETLEPLRQNIILVDVAIPFLYAISVCIGFMASVLLTRRRKPEFAVMRSVGVGKFGIFFGTLAEQAVLSTAGAALGCALIAVTWGYVSFTRPAIFLGCFILGTVFTAVRAARTNVLQILQERE
jgi:small basic protein